MLVTIKVTMNILASLSGFNYTARSVAGCFAPNRPALRPLPF